MYLYTASGLQFEKVFNGSLFSIFRKMFIYILFDHLTVCLNCHTVIENKKSFWRTSNASRRSDYLGHSIGFSSKPLLTCITSTLSLILSVWKNRPNISESASVGFTNEAALTFSSSSSSSIFRRASVSFCKSLNGSLSSVIAGSWFVVEISALMTAIYNSFGWYCIARGTQHLHCFWNWNFLSSQEKKSILKNSLSC